MKTTMKQLAAGKFIALLLLVGNVNAEGTETKASSRETIETTLQLENWMTNENIWNTKSSINFEIEQESETGLQLETWMTDAETWGLSRSLVVATDEALELECWMTCEKVWNNYNNVEETETELTVETWMTSNNIWNR